MKKNKVDNRFTYFKDMNYLYNKYYWDLELWKNRRNAIGLTIAGILGIFTIVIILILTK